MSSPSKLILHNTGTFKQKLPSVTGNENKCQRWLQRAFFFLLLLLLLVVVEVVVMVAILYAFKRIGDASEVV